jgi:hypothetical protein
MNDDLKTNHSGVLFQVLIVQGLLTCTIDHEIWLSFISYFIIVHQVFRTPIPNMETLVRVITPHKIQAPIVCVPQAIKKT